MDVNYDSSMMPQPVVSPEEDGPWKKYQAVTPEEEGPWTKYKASPERSTKGGFKGAPPTAEEMFGAENPYADPNARVAQQELAKGVPIARQFLPQTDEMTEFEKKNPGATQLLHALGGVTSTAPLTMIGPAAGVGTRMLQQGGIFGGLETADTAAGDIANKRNIDWNNAIEHGLGSGLMAAGGSYAGDALSGVVAPRVTDAVRHLLDRDVPLTAGQVLSTGSQGGFARRLEDSAQTFPILGPAIRRAREGAAAGYDRAIANEALGRLHDPNTGQMDPLFQARGITDQVPERYPAWHNQGPGTPQGGAEGNEIGHGFDTRAYTRENIQRAYTTAYDGVNLTRAPALQARITAIGDALQNSGQLTDEMRARYDNLMRGQVTARFDRVRGVPPTYDPNGNIINPGRPPVNGGRLNADAVGNIDTQLREHAERFHNGTGDERTLAVALDRARDAFNQEVGRQFPDAQRRLARADDAWRHYSVMREAGSSTAVQGEEGLISPTQLRVASKHNDPSYENVATSENRDTYGPLAHAGKQVLPSKVHESGTPETLGMAALGGYAVAEPHKGIPIIAGLTAGSGLYGQRAQALARALIAGAPETRAAAAAPLRYGGGMAAALAARENPDLEKAIGQTAAEKAAAVARALGMR